VEKPQVDLLNKGFVRLEHVAGDDLFIVNAARISFLQKSTELTKREEGLINFLMRERHGTPFEMVEFWWHIKCPIFVTREWMRHRIASYNEMSGRYRELPGEFYLPAPEAVRTQVGKPGAYRFESVDPELAIKTIDRFQKVYDFAWTEYQEMLGDGIAKELARDVLPVGIYTEFMFKCNLRSLMNFISLRAANGALYEIRIYAQVMAKIVANIVPITWARFEEHGRVCP
jgi:thymidylate synthase (FAD)